MANPRDPFPMSIPGMPEDFYDPREHRNGVSWQPGRPLTAEDAFQPPPAELAAEQLAGPAPELWPDNASRERHLEALKAKAFRGNLQANPTLYETLDAVSPKDALAYGYNWLGDKAADAAEWLVTPRANSGGFNTKPGQGIPASQPLPNQMTGQMTPLTKDMIRNVQGAAAPAAPPAVTPTPVVGETQGDPRTAGETLGRDAVEYATTYEDPYVDAAKRIGINMAAQHAIMDQIQANGMQGLKESQERLQAAYAKVDLDMAKLKIDPNRWEKETPAFTQALMLIGAGAFGFITKGKTANPILGLMDRAIQKDVDAQMVNYDLAMKRSGMQLKSEHDREYARQKMQAAMWGRAVHGLNAIAQAGQSELSVLQAGQASQLAQEKLKLEYAKVFGVGAKKYSQNLDAEKKLKEGAAGIKDVSSLLYYMQKMPEGKLGRAWETVAGWIPTVQNATTMYDEQRDAMGRLVANAVLSGVLSDREGQTFIKKMPNKWMDNKQASTLFREMIDKIDSGMNAHWDSLNDEQKAKMERVYNMHKEQVAQLNEAITSWAKR